ncbi:MAG: hypothetical protein H6835_06435 [Planctomycetes bacterium]|nr:hypothetical protein [Planctomycetota bacterium]
MKESAIAQHLLGLSPKARVWVGLALVAVAVAGVLDLWGRGVIWYGSLALFLFGLVLFVGGWRELRRQAVVAAELGRVDAEWAELRQAIAEWRRRGDNVARQLQQRGYREYFVRQWIVARAREEGDVA